jgi:gamma-glutamylcyclotransferase (GGCT)/AIG2-like uncharacterized protein YtfP
MESNYLFVYGTLLKDFESYMSKFLNRNSEFIGSGYFNGRLYEISWYPGAVLSDVPSEKVYGHIFKIHNGEKAFKILDNYEGLGDTSEHSNEYKREIIEAYLHTGERQETWVYLYNQHTMGLKRIESGNFLQKLD